MQELRSRGMTKIVEYERRMNNWRLWKISERRSLGGSPYPVYNLSPRPPRGENIMPILSGEAQQTDEAVRALPPNLRRAVEVWFLYGGSINDKRKMLRCRRERMMDLLEQARSQILGVVYGPRAIDACK
jgi:hypothetical protein